MLVRLHRRQRFALSLMEMFAKACEVLARELPMERLLRADEFARRMSDAWNDVHAEMHDEIERRTKAQVADAAS